MNFDVTCNEKASLSAANYVIYIEVFGAAVTFVLRVRLGDIITCA